MGGLGSQGSQSGDALAQPWQPWPWQLGQEVEARSRSGASAALRRSARPCGIPAARQVVILSEGYRGQWAGPLAERERGQ